MFAESAEQTLATLMPLPVEYAQLVESFQISLEARNRASATVTIYLDAVQRLGRFLVERDLPTALDAIRRQHIEAFIAHLLETGSPGTAVNRYKSLQAFFKWAVEEEEIPVSPMAGMQQPSVPDQPPRVLGEDDLRALLKACEGRGFAERRDTALIMLLLDSGMRRGEAAGLMLEDVDLKAHTALVTGKGARRRICPFGARTAQALDRYRRVRSAHPLSGRPELWIGPAGPLTVWGIADIVERRGLQAGIGKIHPHLFRHYFAHSWMAAGGGDDALMQLAGWRSREMLNRYGRSASAERARDAHKRLSPGDRL